MCVGLWVCGLDDVLFWWNLSSVWVEMVLSWIVPRHPGVESSSVRGRNIFHHYNNSIFLDVFVFVKLCFTEIEVLLKTKNY